MKTKIIIILLILSTAVIYGQKKTSRKSQYITKILNEENGSIPKGTKVNILKKHDKKTNTDIEIIIPISGNANFDSQLHNIIENEKDGFLADSPLVKMPNYFGVKPVSIYVSQNIISFAFEIETQNGDAGHGGAIYYSYNFDVKKNKEIKFDDYFAIESDEEKNFTTGLIDESVKLLDEENGESGKWEEFDVNFSEVDFNIQKDTIIFNLGFIRSYVQGLFRAEVNKSKLVKFINSDYR